MKVKNLKEFIEKNRSVNRNAFRVAMSKISRSLSVSDLDEILTLADESTLNFLICDVELVYPLYSALYESRPRDSDSFYLKHITTMISKLLDIQYASIVYIIDKEKTLEGLLSDSPTKSPGEAFMELTL